MADADEAEKILRQMRSDRARQPKDPSDIYVKLRIYKARRRSLAVILAISFVFFMALTTTNVQLGHNWLTILGPMMLIGGLLALVPPTEEWIYTPWQSGSRKYERHFTD